MKLKLTLLFTLFFFCSHFLLAQTKQEVFGSIQKLVSKTEGQKVKTNDVFSKKDDKLGKQVFTEKEVTVNTIPEGKSKYELVSRVSEISWNDFFDYKIYTEFKNEKLQIVELEFKKPFKSEHFTTNDDGDKYPRNYTKFKFYVLTNDKEEITQLLNRLESLKEKKPESAFNKEIQKFTQEQTLAWLREKLKKHLTGDGNTTSINIISMDACELVFDYTNFVGRKYRETIPTNIASINKYNQFTYKDDICISKSYAFGMIQEKDETSYKDKSFLNIYTEDENLISNIEFAMKHLAGFCNNTNFNTAKATQASTELNLALWTMEEIEQLSKMYELKFNTIFSSNALATMEVKAKDRDLYKTLLEEIEVNMDWKKTDKTVNKIPGTAFLLYEGSRQIAEIFLNEDKQFCYYNCVVLSSDFAATITELKEKKFILKINKVGSEIEEQWEKDGVPYQIRVLYNEGEKAGSIALIAMSFLKK